jgi:predicted thioesterase
MTQHPDISRRPGPRRAALRTGTMSAIVLAAMLFVGSASVPATAGPSSTGPASPATDIAAEDVGAVPAAPSDQGTVGVSIIEISHPVAQPGDDVTIRARITNNTDAAVFGMSAQLTVDYLALTSREQIAAWSDAELLDPVYGQPTSESINRLAPGASTNVSFTYDPGFHALQGFGPRRLAVSVDDATGRVGIARTFLMYDADGAERAPMQLSVLAAVTSPATDPSDPDAAEIELAQQAADGQRLDGVLRVAEDTDLSLAVDPNVMSRASRSEDPALTKWSDRLLAAAEKTATYTLPNYDLDLAALAHAEVYATGQRSFLRPPRTSWRAPESWKRGLAWPADGVVPDLETLDLAVATGRKNVVVGGGGLAYEGYGTLTGRADVQTASGTAHAAVTDTALTQAFVSATDLSGVGSGSAEGATDTSAETSTATTATEGAQRLLAETASIVSQSPTAPPTVSIAAPRTWTPDADAAVSILDTLDEASWVDTTTLDTLFEQEAQNEGRTPLPEHHPAKAEISPSDVAALEHARDAVVTFSSVAGEEQGEIWRPGVIRLIAPLSVAQRQDPGRRSSIVQQVLQTTNELTHRSITVVPREDINFITDVGNIPVRVRNGLELDATVTVVLRPDHPRLTVDARSVATVPAGQEVDVQVPVRAIGSGDVAVTAQILTPTGAKISDDSSFQVRVRAGWEEVGTWIAAGLVALLFLAGIWRTVRRGKSPYRATSKDVEEATGTSVETMESPPTTSASSVAVPAE